MSNRDEASQGINFDGSPEELKALYTRMKKEFSLQDLKAFQVDEKDVIPFSALVAELEEMARAAKAERNKE